MAVPNHKHIVDAVYATGLHKLTSQAEAGRFTESVCVELHALDANWGHLRKPSSRTHVVDVLGNRHAVDALLYRKNGQIVDIIRGAGDPDADTTWGPGEREHEYGEGDWYAPPKKVVGEPIEEPPPATEPPPVTISLPMLSEQVAVLKAQNEAILGALNKLILAVTLPQLPPPVNVTFPRYKGTARGRFLGVNATFEVDVNP